jgi:demethylmenaquinone methyltransferase / 2-methoxy-6-polyprenyl-1,4-benzoquinol methylase
MTTPDPVEVNSMFGRIARRYDLANRLLSGGRDVAWRRRLVAEVRRSQPSRVLDLATGSGDVAFALGAALPPPTEIVGMDFCLPMLAEAEKKLRMAGPEAFPRVRFVAGDGLALPVPEGDFDAVTISFGLRNMADRARSLREMRRALRPGGRLFVLEFSQPSPWLRPWYYFYLRRVLPAIAGWVTRDRAAYEYLNASIAAFPNRAGLAAEIHAAGFFGVTSCALSGGIVALHQAVRQ